MPSSVRVCLLEFHSPLYFLFPIHSIFNEGDQKLNFKTFYWVTNETLGQVAVIFRQNNHIKYKVASGLCTFHTIFIITCYL